ncbi:hypothetical protein TWF569_007491 [Orbilia oligospora]|uniref:Mid2 domain-containing protein n=1 Tax=Orbilia oligospora TaxID=2813651 RepID=A0A7C8NR63_ORBOL|nr:hypothetical protein TWF103_005787 [Orbilia oligospora]KAF3114229.1 hypothetical protein TWF706_008168 [Orbilia oligospora]KAF3137164.1 hypothetical protein TWF594_007676 [Orbilia oligospora]KAF3137211.1 hypothetical protein TWF703_005133 [Orbilia oligospora]KAF3142633.1 hypothetical protein TWF569_007491 [Orbilia oligospora]
MPSDAHRKYNPGLEYTWTTTSPLAPYTRRNSLTDDFSFTFTTAASPTSSTSASITQISPTVILSTETRSSPNTTSTGTTTTNPILNENSRLAAGAIAGMRVGFGVLFISLMICLYIIYRLKIRQWDRSLVKEDLGAAEQWGGIGPDNDAPGQLDTGR